MADINDYTNRDGLLDAEHAQAYAAQVATEVVEAVKAQTRETSETTGSKGSTMSTKTDLELAADAVVTETQVNAKIIGGEILLDNIETIADKLIMSRLSWWKKLTISKADKEIAVTLATYAIVHAIKTGGFGMTSYRVNHAALDMVTLAANARLMKYVQKSAGIDHNLAGMILKVPEVSTAS